MKRVERLEGAIGPPTAEGLAEQVAESLGLAADDELVPVLAGRYARAVVIAASAASLEHPDWHEDEVAVAAAAAGDAVLRDARAALKADPSGYRDRILAESD